MARFEEHQTCFYFKNDLPSLGQDVVTLASIDLNNNVSDNDSNIDESKEKKLQFSLNTGSDGKASEQDDGKALMKMASDERLR